MTYYQYPPQPVAQPTSGLAVGALICGIFGFLTCGLTAPIALVLGIVALSRNLPGRGQAWAGTILGGAIVLIWILMFLFGFWSSLLGAFDS
jgi:hypothetical protein